MDLDHSTAEVAELSSKLGRHPLTPDSAVVLILVGEVDVVRLCHSFRVEQAVLGAEDEPWPSGLLGIAAASLE